jgi:hypothetical protein
MDNSTFINLVDQQHLYRKRLLDKPEKKRMGGTEDRLIQFKRMAKMRKCTTASAAVDLCTKQFTDILDMADGSHSKSGDIKYLRELIADVQNYLDITLIIASEEQ